MIYFDQTQTSRFRHPSGLGRVAKRLLDELTRLAPGQIQPVRWRNGHGLVTGPPPGRPIAPGAADLFFTTELFAENERPGWKSWWSTAKMRRVALFHDSIPLQWPHHTWEKSVARHPYYLSELAANDSLVAVSQESADSLLGYWRWLNISHPPPIDILHLGADFDGRPRIMTPTPGHHHRPDILCLGILEPRKNQTVLLAAAERLWKEGLAFQLTLIGRAHAEHSGRILSHIERLRRHRRPLRHLTKSSDAEVRRLFASAACLVMPSQAEGFGLPVWEALWSGLPVFSTPVPSARAAGSEAGVRLFAPDDTEALTGWLRRLLADPDFSATLRRETAQAALRTWSETAGQLLAILRQTESGGS